jgi:hypothetical protein
MRYNPYRDYYVRQAGGGVASVYRGSASQRGRGLGSLLGGLFGKVLLLFTRGIKSVGRQAAKAGLNVLSDVASDIPIKHAFKRRFGDAGIELKRQAEEKIDSMMSGSGINRRNKRKFKQSRKPNRKKKVSRVSKRNKLRQNKDIFL